MRHFVLSQNLIVLERPSEVLCGGISSFTRFSC